MPKLVSIEEFARRERTFATKFIATATEGKIVAWDTREHLIKRGQHGNRSQFEVALSRVPDHSTDPDDAI